MLSAEIAPLCYHHHHHHRHHHHQRHHKPLNKAQWHVTIYQTQMLTQNNKVIGQVKIKMQTITHKIQEALRA